MTSLNDGMNINQNENGKSPIFLAAQQGHDNIVRLHLDNGTELGPTIGNVLDILQQAGPGRIRAIGCFDGNTVANFAEEGVDYAHETKKLEADSAFKISHIDSFIELGKIKIPTTSYHIYFTRTESPRAIDETSLNKTVTTIIRLNEVSNDWKHYIVTNNASFIPPVLKKLINVEVHLIDEYQNSSVYPKLKLLLSTAKDKADFVAASDIARVLLLEQGGVYFDLDYEVYNAEKLLKLHKGFNFYGGKEAEEVTGGEARLIGNSILAASANHPVILTSMDLIKRNYNQEQADKIPDYIKFPCSQASAVAYKAGGPVISTAYYLSANNGTNDIVLPNTIFYNYHHAWSITPSSKCHIPGMVVPLDNDAIGADMFCGEWTNSGMIYYPKNLDAYLFEAALLGYTKIAKFFLENGANINAINKQGIAPLHVAVHNGYYNTAEFLLKNGAKPDSLLPTGESALVLATYNGALDLIKLLLQYGANKNIMTKGLNLAQIASQNGHAEAAKLLSGEQKLGCYEGSIKEIFTQEGIDYYSSNKRLMGDAYYKLNHLNEYSDSVAAIPQVTHQIYLSSKIAPKKMNDICLDITLRTLNRLNQANENWKHYVWTNNPNIIQDDVKNIANVAIRLISEFKDDSLHTKVNLILDQAKLDKAMFSKASDLLRYKILKEVGGLYRDLDYEVYDAVKLLTLMKKFNFLGGKEYPIEPTFIGSAFVGAVAEHPIINEALRLIGRNFNNDDVPDYIKYPCTKEFKLLYETGPSVITMAAHKMANVGGDTDLIMPGYHLFNMDYANYINPKSPCHIPGRIVPLNTNTIGADLFCGEWHKEKGYADMIYYSHHLFAAVAAGNINHVKEILDSNIALIDIDNEYGAKPIHIAARQGDNAMVRFLLEKGASLENGPNVQSIEENILEILLPVGDKKVKFIGCYDSNSMDVFSQEGINYQQENQRLIADSLDRSRHIDEYTGNKKVVAISHVIYFSSTASLKAMDSISQQKTIINAQRLSGVEPTYKHYVWTNNESVIPETIKNKSNVEMHLIEELQGLKLYPELRNMLAHADNNKKMLVAASDVARLIILNKFGGLYHDLDYEIFRPEKLLQLIEAFHFVAGKEGSEAGEKLTLIGNSILFAEPGHPIINKAIDIAFDNINGNGHDYPKYPCGKASELTFKAGAPVISIAYFLAANKNGTVDIVMPHQVFYDFEYIRYLTPESPCHIPNKTATLAEATIGADMFCGSWHQNSGFENLNYYDKNKDAYLLEAASLGYTRIVEYFLKEKGANIEANNIGFTPLHIATRNGHKDTVHLLLTHGANLELKASNQLTALSIAAQNKNPAMVELILKYNPNIESPFPSGATPLYVAAYLGDEITFKLLLDAGAKRDVVVEKLNIRERATNLGHDKIVQILDVEQNNIDNQFIFAVSSDNLPLAKHLIQMGANLDSRCATGEAALHLAAQNGNTDMVRLLLQAGASLAKDPSLATQEQNILEILLQAGDHRPRIVNCYHKLNEEIFTQEGIDYKSVDLALVENSANKTLHIKDYLSEKAQIPLAVHQMYFTSKTSPGQIDELSLGKVIASADRLHKIDQQWAFHFWTNNPVVIQQSIKDIPNLTIHMIDELQGHKLYQEVVDSLKFAESQNDKTMFVRASDIVRYIVLQKFGGIYYDLDYEIYNAEKLLNLLKSFELLVGKETEEEVSAIGNAFMASVPEHPVMNTVLDLVKRNLNQENHTNIPKYLNHGCTKWSETWFATSPAVFTMAVYKAANTSNLDYIAPSKVFFNFAYARSHAPSSRCYDPKNIVDNLDESTVGADMFCGSWSANKNFLNFIYHPENIDRYLHEAASLGYTPIVAYFLKDKGANIDANNATGSTPLHIATQNGHTDTVAYLLAQGANLEIKAANQLTALSIAVQRQYSDIVELILRYHPNIESAFPSGATPLYVAAYLGDYNIFKLLLKAGAKSDVEVNGLNIRQITANQGHEGIGQILDVEQNNIDNQFILAVNSGDLALAKNLLEKGANVNARYESGETALFLAALNRDIKIIQLLLEHQVNTEAAVGGHTPLYVAIYKGYIDAAELLLANGANIEDNAHRFTPMFIAAAKGLHRNASANDVEMYKLVQEYYWKDVAKYQLSSEKLKCSENFEVVVARCNEDISWIPKEFPGDKVTIYNKCDPLNISLPANYNVVNTPNVGLECYAYLKHIVDHYDQLAERTLFLQGAPYDHPVYLPLAMYKTDMVNSCGSIIAKCENTTIKKELDAISHDLATNAWATYDSGKYSNVVKRDLDFLGFIDKFICEYPLDTSLAINWGAEFAVNAETIKNHNIDYYNNILSVLNITYPIEVHYLERLWDLVFLQCPYNELEVTI